MHFIDFWSSSWLLTWLYTLDCLSLQLFTWQAYTKPHEEDEEDEQEVEEKEKEEDEEVFSFSFSRYNNSIYFFSPDTGARHKSFG